MEQLRIEGQVSGHAHATYPFTATLTPITATQPITYVWQATDQIPIAQTNGISNTAVFTWTTPGVKTLTVTATNVGSTVSITHQIEIAAGTPTTMTITAMPDSIAADGISTSTITATVVDGDENLVMGQAVTFTTSLGAVAPITGTTDTRGVVTTTLTSTTTTGVATVTATADITGTALVTFTEPMLSEVTGAITIQGRADHAVELTVSLFETDAVTPSYVFTPTATSSGEFNVGGISPGTYEILVRHAGSLQLVETVTLAAGPNSVDFGQLPAGDANGDNLVTLEDFSILTGSFDLAAGDPGFDVRADFNGDGAVTLTDFSLLVSNFDTAGEEPPGLP